jgi:hypothetical protein
LIGQGRSAGCRQGERRRLSDGDSPAGWLRFNPRSRAMAKTNVPRLRR